MMYRPQKHWGWVSAVEMFCGAAAGGTYLASVASYLLAGKAPYLPGVLASVALVAAAVVLLLADMPSVWLAPKALANLRSPQARGGLSLALFAVLAVVTAAMVYAGGALGVVAWVGALAALATMVYPGTVMGSMRTIPLWSGATPSLLVLCAALLSGAAVVTALGGAVQAAADLRTVTLWLLFVYGAVLFAHVAMASQGPGAARASARLLVRGRLAYVFWLGVVLVGVVLPVVSYSLDMAGTPGPPAQFASLFVLAGGMLFRYCILASAVKTPVLREDALTATYWLRN